MRTFPGRQVRRSAALGGVAAAAILICACRWIPGARREGPRIFVPELGTAREQLAFARQRRLTTIIPKSDVEKRDMRLAQVLAAYEKVVELFPDDLEFTPVARLQVCELRLRYGQPAEALKLSEAILAIYGDLPYEDARARYLRGRSLEELGARAEAQAAYKDCLDRYVDSDDEAVKMVVALCRDLYERVVVE
jgi:tetratricopeptide (TPR) repeat protein